MKTGVAPTSAEPAPKPARLPAWVAVSAVLRTAVPARTIPAQVTPSTGRAFAAVTRDERERGGHGDDQGGGEQEPPRGTFGGGGDWERWPRG